MDIYLILIVFVVAIIVFAVAYSVALYFASKNIFSGSGSPINMANVLLQSILAAGQIIAGLAILTIITILIIAKYISSEVGLPIIAAITGYLVSRSFDNKIAR